MRVHAHGRSLAPLLLGLSLLGLLQAACLPTDALDVFQGSALFNDRLRPDLEPLSAAQSEGPPWVERDDRAYHGDGGPDGAALVSPLHHSMIPSDRLRTLRRSECLFVEDAGFPVLSFEAVFLPEDVGDAEINLERVGLCDGIPRDPVTREGLVLNGAAGNFAIGQTRETVGVFVYSGDDADENPYGACTGERPRDRVEVILADELVGGAEGTFLPWCLLQGSVPDPPRADSRFELDFVDRETREPVVLDEPGLAALRTRVGPDLKVVPGRRTIARPLEFAGSDYDAENDRWIHTFAWRVPSVDASGGLDPAGPFWRENFAPSVLVDRVAFFVQTSVAAAPPGSPERDYVVVDKLRVAEVGDLGPREPIPFDAGCDAEQGGDPEDEGALYLAGCEITATPTYALSPDVNGRMTEKLEWRVQFYTPGESDPLPVEPGERFFIEFDLTAPIFGSGQGALMIDPDYAYLGRAPVGTKQRRARAATLWNVGDAAVRVESIALRHSSAGKFDFALPDGLSLPIVLPAGRAIPLDLLVTTSRWGWQTARLEVEWSDRGARSEALRIPVVAYGALGDLEVLPRALSVQRGTGVASAAARRSLVLANHGNLALERGSLAIEGIHAGFFSVVGSDCGGTAYRPAPASCRIEPGESEIVTVEYHPYFAGLHDARLVIETNVEDDEIRLLGRCTEGCVFPPPNLALHPTRSGPAPPGDATLEPTGPAAGASVAPATSPTPTLRTTLRTTTSTIGTLAKPSLEATSLETTTPTTATTRLRLRK